MTLAWKVLTVYVVCMVALLSYTAYKIHRERNRP